MDFLAYKRHKSDCNVIGSDDQVMASLKVASGLNQGSCSPLKMTHITPRPKENHPQGREIAAFRNLQKFGRELTFIIIMGFRVKLTARYKFHGGTGATILNYDEK